ncbi:dihydropyrimidinase [Clostridium celatum]|uniref:Dihydropyrimidinase n=1 Tax=Clostridium celatum DSM 1785 TaxID=545697 RepID=L1QE00_9CLOT|nr:dihydropyrimidinase [Clostridium celatum]EKY25797.1 dihydropyrimidinase [Clostridium celatum DSM 1785]MCE9653677.1 dihydropyrimidinase [Clostridium celatum]
MSLLIKNGIIVTSSDTFKGDIYIEDGIVKEIGENLNYNKNKTEIIDASGKYVIPVGVDVHTHFNLHVGNLVVNDDFYTGTIAAACGGTTTIIDHIGFGPQGCELRYQINKYHSYADNNAVIDYGFHGVIQHVDNDILNEIEEIVEEDGINSFKAYLTYDYKIEDEDIIKIFKKLKEVNGITAIHCENHGVIQYLRKYYEENGLKSPIFHSLSRPEETEGEAVNRMINIAKIANYKDLYIVHLSTKIALDYIKMARENGQELYVETCPQYLILDESKYKLPNKEGLKYIMSPPLREKYNGIALWKGIRDGYIQTIGTDHCPFSFNNDKKLGKDNFIKCPNGAPGVEERIPLIFSEGVMNGKININKFVEVCSTNPAKIFGIYPKKGTIAIGSDADIVIIDPNKEVILSSKDLHSNVDYSAYEGIKVKGYPIMTILRGKIIVRDNKFIGEKGDGMYLKRKTTRGR